MPHVSALSLVDYATHVIAFDRACSTLPTFSKRQRIQGWNYTLSRFSSSTFSGFTEWRFHEEGWEKRHRSFQVSSFWSLRVLVPFMSHIIISNDFDWSTCRFRIHILLSNIMSCKWRVIQSLRFIGVFLYILHYYIIFHHITFIFKQMFYNLFLFFI